MLSYEQIETDVVSRIGTLPNGILVEIFPETDAQADKSRPAQVTRVMVSYHSSPFPQAELNARPAGLTTDVGFQEEYVRIATYIRSNRLRGVGGLYEAIARVKAKLIGFQPEYASTKFFLAKIEHGDREGGVWEHVLVWSFSTMLQEEIADPEGEPWRSITLEDSDGEENIIENPEAPPIIPEDPE